MAEEQQRREDASEHLSASGNSDVLRNPVHYATSDSSRSNIFALPREIRDNIYRRVLRVAPPLYLFQDNATQVESFVPERPHQWLALLHVNRQFHIEAAEALYGMNVFDCSADKRPQDRLLRTFLARIGQANSASLTHLSINFPGLEGAAQGVKLKDDSLERLDLLQRCCTHLTTAETSFSVKHVENLERVAGENQQLMKEALSQIDSQLRTIASLNTIIVRITGPKPTPSVLEWMEALGWPVRPAYEVN